MLLSYPSVKKASAMASKEPIIPATPDDAAYGAEADQGDVFTHEDPVALFADWFTLASQQEPNDPNAMALATVDVHGRPDVRIVLLKNFDAVGLTFYTNLESAKARQLEAVPGAALCFHWKTIRRQVRFRGPVAPVPAVEADAYFGTRARGSQLGAWASAQSRPLADRQVLIDAIAAAEEKFGEDSPVPRPPHWGGFRLVPEHCEFWVNRPYRLHDRLVFTRDASDGPWATARLFP